MALSRAKERIIFTVSDKREVSNFGNIENLAQTTEKISELLETLKHAGVPTVPKSMLANTN